MQNRQIHLFSRERQRVRESKIPATGNGMKRKSKLKNQHNEQNNLGKRKHRNIGIESQANITNYISKTKPQTMEKKNRNDEETYAKVSSGREMRWDSRTTERRKSNREMCTNVASVSYVADDGVFALIPLFYILIGSLQKWFPCQWPGLANGSQHHFGIYSNKNEYEWS